MIRRNNLSRIDRIGLKEVYDMAGYRGIDIDALRIEPEQLIMGVDHEQEHVRPDEKYPADKAFDIAMDHLREIPDYYTRLERMEAEWREETGCSLANRPAKGNPGRGTPWKKRPGFRGLFELGRLVWTSGMNDDVARSDAFGRFVHRSLQSHASGEWGDLGREDKFANEQALMHNGRLFSSYSLPVQMKPGFRDGKIWIITEADRSATTVLWPDEY